MSTVEGSRYRGTFDVVTQVESPEDKADNWTIIDTKRYGWLLLVGALWPLLVTSFFFAEQRLVWPWDLFGNTSGVGAFTTIPLVMLAAAYCARRFLALRARSIALFLIGFGALTFFSFTTFEEEAFLAGAPFLVMPGSLKLSLLVMTLGAAAVAAANRLAKEYPLSRFVRWLPAAGGGVVIACLCIPSVGGRAALQALISGSAWRSEWAFNLAMLSVLAYGALGVVGAFDRSRREKISTVLSIQARVTLVWIPLAVCIVRGSMGSDPVAMVTDGGQGAAFMATVKCFAVCYGALLLMATGLTAWLAVFLWDRLVPPSVEAEETDTAREAVAAGAGVENPSTYE